MAVRYGILRHCLEDSAATPSLKWWAVWVTLPTRYFYHRVYSPGRLFNGIPTLNKLRGRDLNPRPTGYEPAALPLRHPAIKVHKELKLSSLSQCHSTTPT